MKYIFIASLLTSAVYAAPFRGQGLAAAIAAGQQQRPGQAAAQQGGVQSGVQGAQQGTQGAQQGAQNAQPATNQPSGADTGLGVTLQPGQTPTAGDLATAVSNWMADTSMVSNFLNTGAGIQDDTQFKQAALVAFNAEVDELDHKAIIDAANGNQPNVQSANSTLATGGSFQDVVDKLKLMSVQGRAAVANIDLINQNRCVNVLPNIDAYMASTGSASQAVRPQACNLTGVNGGVQGNGPTLPGQSAGTPAAAFAAASALASGTGNGVVQNGGNGQQGQGATGQRGQGTAGQQTQGATGGQTGTRKGALGGAPQQPAAGTGAGTGATGATGNRAGAVGTGAGVVGTGAGTGVGAGAGRAGTGLAGAGAGAGGRLGGAGAGTGAGAGRLGQGQQAAAGQGQTANGAALRKALAAKFGAGKKVN